MGYLIIVAIILFVLFKVFGQQTNPRIHNKSLEKVEPEVQNLIKSSQHNDAARLIVSKSMGLIGEGKLNKAEKFITSYFHADPETNLYILEHLNTLNEEFDSMPSDLQNCYMDLWDILNRNY